MGLGTFYAGHFERIKVVMAERTEAERGMGLWRGFGMWQMGREAGEGVAKGQALACEVSLS